MTSENIVIVFSCNCFICDSICDFLIHPEFKSCAQAYISHFPVFIVLLEQCVMTFVIFILVEFQHGRYVTVILRIYT